MRLITAILCVGVLSGCATAPQTACEMCAEKNPCQPPPTISLIPQTALTLPTPLATLVKPANGDPYFKLSENAFYVWVDNNQQLAEYIRECRTRTDKVIEYYEAGLKPLRERNSGKPPKSKD